MLEECGLPYVVRPVDISRGEQFAPHFLSISPNIAFPPSSIPRARASGRSRSLNPAPSCNISAARPQILPARGARARRRRRVAVLAVGGLADGRPANHFRRYAPEQIPYAINRYTDEVNRLFGVMNARLAGRDFLAGRYSIADMACVGWVRLAERMGQDLSQFPHLKRWFETIRAREAVKTRVRDPHRSGRFSRHARSESARDPVRPARAVTVAEPQFVRVQVWPLQISPPMTQPFSSAELAPVMANEPV